jgi:hypothetical protein
MAQSLSTLLVSLLTPSIFSNTGILSRASNTASPSPSLEVDEGNDYDENAAEGCFAASSNA